MITKVIVVTFSFQYDKFVISLYPSPFTTNYWTVSKHKTRLISLPTCSYTYFEFDA